MPNEIQLFDLNVNWSDLEAGQLVIAISGIDSNAINFNDGLAEIETAIEAITGIGAGNTSVTLNTGDFTVEFVNSLVNTNIPEATVTSCSLAYPADTISFTEVIPGQQPENESQKIDLGGATTGTFELDFNGNLATVLTLDFAGVGAALDSIIGSGWYILTDNMDGTFNVEFSGAYEYSNVVEMFVSNNTTDGSPVVTTNSDGITPSWQQLQLTLPDTPTEGTITITLDGVPSAAFPVTTDDIQIYMPTGWTSAGVAGNWSITANDPLNSVPYSAEESTPLRAIASVNVSTLQEGSSGSEDILTPEEITVVTEVVEPTIILTLHTEEIAVVTEVIEPTVNVNALSVTVPLVSCTVAVVAPSISNSGESVLTPEEIVVVTEVVEPTVTVGTISVSVPVIIATTTVIEPAISLGALVLTPDEITASTTVVDPTMRRGLYPASSFVGVTTTVVAPTVTTTPISLSPSNVIAMTTFVIAPTVVGGENTVSVDDTWRRRNHRLVRR